MLSLARAGLATARQHTSITRPLCTAAARVVEHPNPLSTLAEDETFIVEAVRSYAENEIQPKVGVPSNCVVLFELVARCQRAWCIVA